MSFLSHFRSFSFSLLALSPRGGHLLSFLPLLLRLELKAYVFDVLSSSYWPSMEIVGSFALTKIIAAQQSTVSGGFAGQYTIRGSVGAE